MLLRHGKPSEITKIEQNPEEKQSLGAHTNSSGIIFTAISEHNHIFCHCWWRYSSGRSQDFVGKAKTWEGGENASFVSEKPFPLKSFNIL